MRRIPVARLVPAVPRFVLVVCGLVLGAAGAFAWQWPVEVPVLEAAFGQRLGDTISRGIVLSGGAQPVYPVAEGVVVYVREEGEQPPLGSGTMVVVDHDRGFRSVYGHLEARTTPAAGTVVTEDTQIGVAGQTGMAERPLLSLAVIDTESGAYVNPLLLLPALEDRVAPSISGVFARSADAFYGLGRTAQIPAGEYTFLAECSDAWATRSSVRVAPYSMALSVDGQERWSVTFDNIIVDDGAARPLPGPGAGADGVYEGDGLFRLGRVVIPVGRTIVEVVAADYRGNEESVVLQIDGLP